MALNNDTDAQSFLEKLPFTLLVKKSTLLQKQKFNYCVKNPTTGSYRTTVESIHTKAEVSLLC
jgi:hypothetical protein